MLCESEEESAVEDQQEQKDQKKQLAGQSGWRKGQQCLQGQIRTLTKVLEFQEIQKRIVFPFPILFLKQVKIIWLCNRVSTSRCAKKHMNQRERNKTVKLLKCSVKKCLYEIVCTIY